MRNKTRSLSNLYCRSSCAFPGTVLFTFAALFITQTLLFNTNSGFFSRFLSFESLPSITVEFPRTFHHLYASLWCFTALFVMWTLLFNNSGVFPRFSSSERFSSTSAAFAVLFIVCKFSRFFYHLHFSCALLTSFTPLPPPPHLVPGAPFRFFILCTHFPQFKFFSRLLSFTPVASFPVLTLSYICWN